jgi:hypothetical protein
MFDQPDGRVGMARSERRCGRVSSGPGSPGWVATATRPIVARAAILLLRRATRRECSIGQSYMRYMLGCLFIVSTRTRLLVPQCLLGSLGKGGWVSD